MKEMEAIARVSPLNSYRLHFFISSGCSEKQLPPLRDLPSASSVYDGTVNRDTFPHLTYPHKRVFVMRVAIALAALFVAAPVFAQETGTLKVKFVYGGAAFKPEPVNVTKDVEVCGKHPLMNERLLVDAESKGIQNVVLYVYTGRGGSKLPPQTATNATHVLANDKCRFEPRFVVMQAGDTLKITNPDAVGHNANLNFFANPAQNITIPPGAEKMIKVEKPEPAPIPVDCNIHPWMRAYIIAVDHPFVGVSDKNGSLEIKGLPAGEKLTFRLYHEAAGSAIKEVMIDGKATAMKKNLLELDIKSGMNDYGTITIPADALSAQ